MLPANSTFFFFNDTATTEIYTLSLHDALPISNARVISYTPWESSFSVLRSPRAICFPLLMMRRSEEHTSELQSQSNLVCRLLLEKKKTRTGMREREAYRTRRVIGWRNTYGHTH